MRTIEEVRLVLWLSREGLNDCQIARTTGIPRGTVRGWRTGCAPRMAHTDAPASCPMCGQPQHALEALPEPAYSYLLGLYLGDGYIVAAKKRVYRLSVTLDRKYPGIVRECKEAMATVMPRSKVSIVRRRDENADEVLSWSRAWPCLIPQHGPGRKHERRIALTRWQQNIVDREPKRFLRGLIHSDGCYSVNTIRHPENTYVYPRYLFSNRSKDIRQIFCDSCDQLDIEWRQMNQWTISVARHESVAVMDEFIGPKE